MGPPLVLPWNDPLSEATWGLREQEVVGRDVFRLDVGLDFERLREALLHAMHDGQVPAAFTLDATNRRGRPIRCRVRVNPLREGESQAAGAVVLVEELDAGREERQP